MVWGGLGGEEAVEVIGTKRWLDGILGKLVLISVQNLVCLNGKNLKTGHGKPFCNRNRAGTYPLAAR